MLVTCESDHSLESPEMPQNVKIQTVKDLNITDSSIPLNNAENNNSEILHNYNNQPIEVHTRLNSVQVVLDTNENLLLDSQKHPSGINVTSEVNVNLPQNDQNYPNQNFTEINNKSFF